MNNEFKLHSRPSSYNGSNNRKMTLGRYKTTKVQSAPIFKKDAVGNNIEFLGYKYIRH